MIIERNDHGAYIISDIINGYWCRMQYYYYTKKQAISLFKKYIKELKHNKGHYNED